MYLDLARELKRLWNLKVTVIPIAFGELGTISRNFDKKAGRVGKPWTAKNIKITK